MPFDNSKCNGAAELVDWRSILLAEKLHGYAMYKPGNVYLTMYLDRVSESESIFIDSALLKRNMLAPAFGLGTCQHVVGCSQILGGDAQRAVDRDLVRAGATGDLA